jgi:hypothetical protein
METNAKKLGIVLFTMATVFLGCKKDDVQPVSTETSFEEKKADEKVAKWQVESFTMNRGDENPEDLTPKYKDWNFYFNQDGSVDAKYNTKMVKGDWKVEETGGKKFMIINFPVDSELNVFNKKFKLLVPTKTILDLEFEDSGVVNKIKFQTFDWNMTDAEDDYFQVK